MLQRCIVRCCTPRLCKQLSDVPPPSPLAQLLSSWRHHSGVQAVCTLHGGRTIVCGDLRGKWGLARFGHMRGGDAVTFAKGHGREAVSALRQVEDTALLSASSDGTIRACRIEGPPFEVAPMAAVQAHAGGEHAGGRQRRGGMCWAGCATT